MPEAKKEEVAVKDDAPKVEGNPAEAKARADGWRPESEWNGDPSQWVDYREFNVRGELMGRIQEQSNIIHNQKSQVEELRAGLNDLKAMQDKIAENEYKKLLKTLKSAKAAAIEDANGEAVAELEDEIDNLKEAYKEQTAPKPQETVKQQQQQLSPEVQAWLAKPQNSWYNTNVVMRTQANAVAAEITKQNPTFTPGQVLAEMDRIIREELPHKFNHSSVDSGDSYNRPNSGSNKRRGLSDLTDDEQTAAKRFIKLGVFKSVNEYIEQLDTAGD